jgi:hypothetical protein
VRTISTFGVVLVLGAASCSSDSNEQSDGRVVDQGRDSPSDVPDTNASDSGVADSGPEDHSVADADPCCPAEYCGPSKCDGGSLGLGYCNRCSECADPLAAAEAEIDKLNHCVTSEDCATETGFAGSSNSLFDCCGFFYRNAEADMSTLEELADAWSAAGCKHRAVQVDCGCAYVAPPICDNGKCVEP